MIDAKTGQEVTEETVEAAGWIDEYEKFRTTEAEEWAKEFAAVSKTEVTYYSLIPLFIWLNAAPI